MDLQGSIENFTLVDILQLIATGRKSGTLGIQRDDAIVMVYFQAGNVTYAYGPRETFHLGALLSERGKITAEQLEEAVATQARTDNAKRLGEIMINKGFIDRADLEEVVREQVEELLYSLLAWRTGSFKFYEDQFPTREEITVSLSIENIILEGLRRIDEQAMIRDTLPDLDQVYRLSSSQAGRTREVSFKASEWNVMALVDGYRSLNQVCEVSPFKRHETLNRMAQLKMAGLIEPSQKTAPMTSASSNLEAMIADLSRLLESYLTQKSSPATSDRSRVKTILQESLSEPD